MPRLRAIGSKLFPTVNVALVAITGVWVKRFSRSTCDTASGARYKVENVGSCQRTCPSPIRIIFWAVIFISLTAPLTRARSAKLSGSTISLSALMYAITASAASLIFRTGAASASGSSFNLRSSSLRMRYSWPYSSIASANPSAALTKASESLPGMCLRAMFAARATRPDVSSSVTACVVRSMNS